MSLSRVVAVDVDPEPMIRLSGRSGVDARIWAVAVDVEHDQWAVLQHGGDVRATPTLRRDLDQRPSLVWVDDYSPGSPNVTDRGLFQVHNNMRVGSDVIDPVAGPVRTWHPADEQHAILLVQEDLDPPTPSRPSSRRRQIDDLTTKQRSPDPFIHNPSSAAHATMIAVHGRDTPRDR
jgi:hypothetical protein